ncbi:MAG: hypothetical protein P1V51_13890 [Deltaproteobacteria bacterium]|nr:hypothetical protein [Deltaproteobacteria bacterium]
MLPRRLSILLVLALLAPAAASAEVSRPRAEVAGYFRIMTRPDLQGGDGRLGFWNLYGRLMNEGPWASLELRVDLLQAQDARDPWVSVHYKIEGGSVMNADAGQGALAAFRMSQLYARAGNVLGQGVEWQLGTLDTWMGDLALYDQKPAQLFFDTLGLSATLKRRRFDLTVGLGDAGFAIRGRDYSPVLTAGLLARLRLGGHLELGGGGQTFYEPEVAGNRNSPHTTANLTYENFIRREVVSSYLQQNPGSEDLFYDDNVASSTYASSYKVVGYLGFGGFGPLTWNNLFANLSRLHPEVSTTETVVGRDYTLYVSSLTDQRFQLTIGNEAQLKILPERLDAIWALLYGRQWNDDNEIAAGEDNRTFLSSVLRLQLYLTPSLHLLLESSLARERSLNGNLWRQAHDSIFQSSVGQADARGLEFGDTDTRDTWQVKFGPVLNPRGYGIFSRPSLRLLFGLQRSSIHQAFGSTVVDSLSDNEILQHEATSRYQHAVIALEAEAWF